MTQFIKLSNGSAEFLVDVNNIAEIQEKQNKGFKPVMLSNGKADIVTSTALIQRQSDTNQFVDSDLAELLARSLDNSTEDETESTVPENDEQPDEERGIGGTPVNTTSSKTAFRK